MRYKQYGRTGKRVSVIACGGMRFVDPTDIDGSAEVVLHAHRRGVNYFDTAPYYQQDKSEDIFGAAIRQMKPGTFYISTKCSEPTEAGLRKDLERSLKRLGVERIDFYHIWSILTPEGWRKRVEGGAVAAAFKAKAEGLISHVVVSSHMPGHQLKAVLKEGQFEGVTLNYSAIDFTYRQEGVDAAGEMGVGVVTMNPLGGGLIPRHAERLGYLKGPGDPSVVAAALRFNVSQPAITAALVGFSTTQQVDEACDAVENFEPYSPQHIEEMRKSFAPNFKGICTGCGYCMPCPKGVDIPRMMDACNHKLLSDGADDAITNRLAWHWSLTPEAAAPCVACGVCEKKCTQHLSIADRMKEIASLAKK